MRRRRTDSVKGFYHDLTWVVTIPAHCTNSDHNHDQRSRARGRPYTDIRRCTDLVPGQLRLVVPGDTTRVHLRPLPAPPPPTPRRLSYKIEDWGYLSYEKDWRNEPATPYGRFEIPVLREFWSDDRSRLLSVTYLCSAYEQAAPVLGDLKGQHAVLSKLEGDRPAADCRALTEAQETIHQTVARWAISRIVADEQRVVDESELAQHCREVGGNAIAGIHQTATNQLLGAAADLVATLES